MEPEDSSCSQPTLVDSSPYVHICSPRHISILSSHLCQGLPRGFFLCGFLTKMFVCISFLHRCNKSHTVHPSWFTHTNNIRGRI